MENREKESVGTIEKAGISRCKKRSVASFTAFKGSKMKIGIKKRNIKNLLVAIYIEEQTYFLKDKPGNSLLYYCVIVNIDEENWSGEIEVKIDQIHIATIKANEFSKTTILTEDNISESSLLFTVTILMYFMYKIYKKESEFIDEYI